MSRLLALVVFVVALASGSAAFAQHGRGHGGNEVPELSGGAGAAAGLILVGGVAAIVFARRRGRKQR